MTRVEVAAAGELYAPLKLLERALRKGDPLPETFVNQLQRSVEAGDSEVLVAYEEEAVGVVFLSYRPSISAGGCFASVEELYVEPEARRQGVGRMLLEEVGRRCRDRGVSYVEAQTVDGAAEAFYAAVGYEYEEGVRVMSWSYAL